MSDDKEVSRDFFFVSMEEYEKKFDGIYKEILSTKQELVKKGILDEHQAEEEAEAEAQERMNAMGQWFIRR